MNSSCSNSSSNIPDISKIKEECDSVIDDLAKNQRIFLEKISKFCLEKKNLVNKFGFLLFMKMVKEVFGEMELVGMYGLVSGVVIVPIIKALSQNSQNLQLTGLKSSLSEPNLKDKIDFKNNVKVIVTSKKYQFLPKKCNENPIEFWKYLYKFNQAEEKEEREKKKSKI